MLVAVGSINPVKVKAVEKAFKEVWPQKEIMVRGIEVDSGVSSQPMSDEESIQGATNRAQKSLKELNADYGVGLEGGLHKIGSHWFDSGWMVVVDKKGNVGIGSSIKMHTSDKLMNHIHNGKELGEATDIEFKVTNSKQGDGHFGLMTNNLVTRTDGYRQGLISALARFIHPEVYED